MQWVAGLLRIKRALLAGVLASLALVLPFAPSGALLPSVALAGCLGLGAALAYALSCEALRLLPRRVQLFCVGVAGGAGGCLALARPLGAFSKLEGEHSTLAFTCVLVSVLAGGLGMGTLWWLRPRAKATHPMRRIPVWLRWTVLFGAGALAMLLATFEATHAWMANYPALQHGLLLASWVFAFASALSALCALDFSRAARRVVVVGLVAIPLAFGCALWNVNPTAIAAMSKSGQTEHWVWFGRTLTDWDRDGSSSLLGGGDCAAFDPSVSPRQREIKGNGIDDNCRHGDAPALPTLPARDEAAQLTVAPQRARDSAAARPNLVLVTIDALRSDRTTPYGYARNTTPELSRFAESAVVFEHAYTSGGWTCLALPSLFGGVYPRRLEWSAAAFTSKQRLVLFPWRAKLALDESFVIGLTVPKVAPEWWLPLALQQHGYRTIAVPPPALAHMTHLFERGWDQVASPEVEVDAALTDLALQRVALTDERPFFLWVHYFDPHEPQTEHAEVPSFGTSIEDKYDHEVAATDHAFGRLLRGIEALSAAPTAWIVTADHGEAFAGGLQFHGTDLFEEGIAVPLLLRAPGVAPGRVATPASLVDLAPTLLGLAQLAAPPGLDGQDLRSLDAARTVITDLLRVGQEGEPLFDQTAVTNAAQRLVHDNLKQVQTLVRVADRARPPHELEPGLAAAELQQALARYEESAPGL